MTFEQPISSPNEAERESENNEEMMRRLRALVDGQLTAVEADELLDTISQSDEWLQIADALWAENLAHLENVPALPPDQAHLLERKINNRIHRTDLISHILRFGLQGFALVTLALLRPFLNGFKMPNEGAQEVKREK
jgi:hypothetical protein